LQRDAGDVGKGHDVPSVNLEMIVPAVSPGMEQPNRLSRTGMDRSNVTPFATIAYEAGEGKIVGRGWSAVFPAHDVIN